VKHNIIYLSSCCVLRWRRCTLEILYVCVRKASLFKLQFAKLIKSLQPCNLGWFINEIRSCFNQVRILLEGIFITTLLILCQDTILLFYLFGYSGFSVCVTFLYVFIRNCKSLHGWVIISPWFKVSHNTERNIIWICWNLRRGSISGTKNWYRIL